MEAILKVEQYLIDNAEKIIREITDMALKNVEFEISDELLEKSIQQNVEFLVLLAKSFKETDEKAAEELIKWSKNSGEQQAAAFGRFSTLIKPYAKNRLLYLDYITQISIDHGLATKEVAMINNRICYLMDISLTETLLAYETYRDELMHERQKEINKLSAPIVPIQKGIAVLPLIGVLDYPRVQHLLNHVVPTIPSLDVEHLIIDFSGILTIDKEVAQNIFVIHNVLDLLGINLMLTGMRPQISMAVVHGGIDFTSFNTYGSVKHAIDSIKNGQ